MVKMKTKALAAASAVLALSIGFAGGAHAAPVNADSVLGMFHGITINSGSVPDGLSVVRGPLAGPAGVSSGLDDPGAVEEADLFVQIGDTSQDPDLPYIARRFDRTTVNGGLEGAQGRYETNVLTVDDPEQPLSIVRRVVDTEGDARIFLSSVDVAAEARSSFLMERSVNFTNESDATVAFNIVGTVTASLLAAHDGTNGFARTSGRVFTLFDDLVGTTISHLPLAPYLRTIEDDGPGATVAEALVFDPRGGFTFSAAASAIADGTDVRAAFDASFAYLFQVRMDPGASFVMVTGSDQTNAVAYDGPGISIAPVPVPAAAWLLLVAFGGLAAIKRRR